MLVTVILSDRQQIVCCQSKSMPLCVAASGAMSSVACTRVQAVCGLEFSVNSTLAVEVKSSSDLHDTALTALRINRSWYLTRETAIIGLIDGGRLSSESRVKAER